MEEIIISNCWCCNTTNNRVPIEKHTYYGKKNGKRVQKTIPICLCCSAMTSSDDILEQIRDTYGWDEPDED